MPNPKKPSKKPKSRVRNTATRVSTRTALVYTGAAILIVVVGLRTLLQMTDEGFGVVEFITIGALGVEFAVLLLYAFTIYSSGLEEARQEQFAVEKQDMPEVATQLRLMSDSISEEVHELQKQNQQLQKQFDDLTRITDRLIRFAERDLDKPYDNMAAFTEQSAGLLSQLISNEQSIQKHAEEIRRFTTGLDQLISEQITLRIRQEIQKLLTTAVSVDRK